MNKEKYTELLLSLLGVKAEKTSEKGIFRIKSADNEAVLIESAGFMQKLELKKFNAEQLLELFSIGCNASGDFVKTTKAIRLLQNTDFVDGTFLVKDEKARLASILFDDLSLSVVWLIEDEINLTNYFEKTIIYGSEKVDLSLLKSKINYFAEDKTSAKKLAEKVGTDFVAEII